MDLLFYKRVLTVSFTFEFHEEKCPIRFFAFDGHNVPASTIKSGKTFTSFE